MADRIPSFDMAFARFLKHHDREACSVIMPVALALTAHLREGHILIDLNAIAKTPRPDTPESIFPDTPALQAMLLNSPVVGTPNEPSNTPLLLDGNRLYLRRYFEAETKIRSWIESREPLDARDSRFTDRVAEALARFFPEPEQPIDWQLTAAANAVLNPYSVISGGPGTGKTTTVAKIIATLAALGEIHGNIALCAPTGKAAARLKESVESKFAGLFSPVIEEDGNSFKAYTLHRLLGGRPGHWSFRYNRSNPLPFGLVILDETSMVSLLMFSALIDALNSDTKLILLGDRDQLASVDAGNIFSDLAGTHHDIKPTTDHAEKLSRFTSQSIPSSPSARPITRTVTLLRKSYRFRSDSGIGLLATAIREGNTSEALSILRSENHPDIRLTEIPSISMLRHRIRTDLPARFTNLQSTADPAVVLNIQDSFRILTAHRDDPSGAETINTAIESALRSPAQHNHIFYDRRPILITRNSPESGLMNGDTGIIIDDPTSHTTRFYTRDACGNPRPVNPALLPPHTTAYAMTIHKSQGSEYDDILIVLPTKPSPVLTRELLYTAVTRAKKSLTIWATESILIQTIPRTVTRNSGLAAKQWPEQD